MVFLSVGYGFIVVSGGWRAGPQYYETVISGLGMLFFFMLIAGIIPTILLLFWQRFTMATSPYPLIGAAVFAYGAMMLTNTLTNITMIEAMSLEIYHAPIWVLKQLRMGFPWLKSRLTDEKMEARARLRAAQLRALVGLHDLSAGGRRPTREAARAAVTRFSA